MSIVDMLFLKASEVAKLEKVIGNSVIEWSEDWLKIKSVAKATTKCRKLALSGDVICFKLKVHNIGMVTLYVNKPDYLNLAKLIVHFAGKGEFELDDFTIEIVQESIKDLVQRCISKPSATYTISQNIEVETSRKKHYGELVSSCKVEDCVFYLHFDVSVVKSLCDRKASILENGDHLVDVNKLIGNCTVNLNVELGCASVKLSELQKLEVGDVIVLEQLINRASQVYIGASNKPIEGILTRVNDSRAIKF